MVILDTNIIIDHLRQVTKADTVLMQIASRLSRANLAISLMTVQELYMGSSTKQPQREAYLLAVMSPLTILPYTYEIAQLAGTIIRDHPQLITFADAAIAATAITYHAELATLNTKDFKGLKNLEILSLD